MGRPLIDLPTPHEVIITIDFNPPEKILYRAVEGIFLKMINDRLDEMDPEKTANREKPEEKDETFVLVRYTRLRQ